jgi:putative NADPH-quinone reductase
LKGWVDQVQRTKIIFQFLEGDEGEGIPVGMLRATVAIALNASNTPEAREKVAFGDPLEALWKRCILPFCGVAKVDHRMFGVVVTNSEAERYRWKISDRETIIAAHASHLGAIMVTRNVDEFERVPGF